VGAAVGLAVRSAVGETDGSAVGVPVRSAVGAVGLAVDEIGASVDQAELPMATKVAKIGR